LWAPFGRRVPLVCGSRRGDGHQQNVACRPGDSRAPASPRAAYDTVAIVALVAPLGAVAFSYLTWRRLEALPGIIHVMTLTV